ncbi:LOW QUALITY PROTEIN: GTPase IMAP family member 8-like [Talpa occidentalis]|uniref:LOW QUALITY PROTEIN: GTPase IMAP family member 8-like n=1 Tax=Talpa occidentalis TaxID=50954 RepID=UPI00188F7BCF|nr:LOW QUALITY PROTEIN: GTPase IMAP family member 8-like [Talpa occidentalis]
MASLGKVGPARPSSPTFPTLLPTEILSFVLVGSGGTGKSMTGNSILGWPNFPFQLHAQLVTTTCWQGTQIWEGQKVVVVDTPPLDQMLGGPGDPCQLEGKVEISFTFCGDEKKILVLVLQLGWFTQKDEKALQDLEAIFREEVTHHMIVLFTRKEELEDREMEDYKGNMDNEALRKIVAKCVCGVCAFNNKDTGQAGDAQVRDLLNTANELVRERGARGYPCAWEGVSRNIKKVLEMANPSSWKTLQNVLPRHPELGGCFKSSTASGCRHEGPGRVGMGRGPRLEEQMSLT